MVRSGRESFLESFFWILVLANAAVVSVHVGLKLERSAEAKAA
jgi:hypothetical protein